MVILATVDYFVGKLIQGSLSITRPTNDQLQQIPLLEFTLLTLGITSIGLKRAIIGRVEPTELKSLLHLEKYIFQEILVLIYSNCNRLIENVSPKLE